MPTDRPNILLVITDNQRADTLGFLGHTPCRTPTWTRVAREGTVLENVRTTSPICSPARASLLTGLLPHQAGMPTVSLIYAERDDGTGGETAPGITRAPISHPLREAGYETFYSGKWHLGERNIKQWFDWTAACDPAERDYSEWCRYHGIPDGFIFHDPVRSKPFRSKHPPHMSLPATGILDIPEDKEHNRWVLGHAFEMFALRHTGRPFFMTLSFEGPHPPLVVPERYYDMYDPADIPEPPNWNANAAEPSFLKGSYYRKLREEWGNDFDRWRQSIAVYWGYVTYIDSLIGEFVQRLEELNLLDNTFVVMVSDHGDMLGQHALSQKMCPYDEALRVPCCMRWPGRIEPGTRCGMDVSLVDLPATLLAAAGIPADGMDLAGEDLLPYLQGARAEPAARDCFAMYHKAPFFDQWHGVENWRCIIRRPWKYALHQDGQAELFHLDHDPAEITNLAGRADSAAIESELHQALLARCKRTGDPFVSELKRSVSS